MAQLENQFSWSRSRNETFLACPRQYYFDYYGSWNGWAADAPPRTRFIYVLKQLKSRQMWTGGVVHDCIARTLQNVRRGIRPLDPEEIIRLALEEMRGAFRSSREGLYRQRPKSLALYEHEYALPVSDEEWRAAVEGALSCLRGFYGSPIYAELSALPRDAWLEVEEFSSFDLEGTKVWVKLDASHRMEGAKARVVDWKTGRVSQEDQTLQLACYALYGTRAWKVAPRDIVMLEYNLAANEVMSYAVSEESLAEVTAYIRGSAADMRTLLVDAESNVPRPEEEFPLAETERPCGRCKYRKVCPRFAAAYSAAPPA